MRRSPAFTLTAVVSLSLATGGVTAIYSLVDAALLRPLPVSRPDRLVVLSAKEIARGGSAPSRDRTTFSLLLFRELRAAAGDVAALGAFSPPNRVELQATADPSSPAERATDQFVSENAMDVLRVPPALGRLFAADDAAAGASLVAVLSWDYWQRRFGGDPGVLDRAIRIDGRVFRVIGVAGQGFFGVEPGRFVDVWRLASTFDPSAQAARGFHWGHIVGRLADGATANGLQARLHSTFVADVAARAQTDPIVASSDASLIVRPDARGLSTSRQAISQPLTLLLAVAGGTLLIACANVASLLLARASSRSMEMAVRTSLGAGRRRLLQQLATENLLLTLSGNAGGWLVAWLSSPYIGPLLTQGRNPIRFAHAMDGRTLIFCAGLGTLSGLFFAVLPAYAMAAKAQMPRLREGASTRQRTTLGRTFVAAQVAFAYCLVASGAAFIFSMSHLLAVHPGFEARNVTVLTVGADTMLGLTRVQAFQERIGALPEVENTAVAWLSIFSGSRRTDRIVGPGNHPSEREEIFYRVSPNYFATLKTPLLAGRDFSFADREGAPEIPTIVNRSFARRYFETESVVGKDFFRADGAHHRIVGVADDSHYGDLRQGSDAVAYFPMKPPRWFTLYVRSSLDAGRVSQIVRREAAALGSGAHLIETASLQGMVGDTIHSEKLLAGAGGAFAGLGLLLAAVGVFGFLNYNVASRISEIGIRAALGATPSRIVTLILSDTLRPISIGVLAGVASSIVVFRLSGALLFGVRPVDPAVLLTATGAFVAAAVLAAALPARRAVRLDPTQAFKGASSPS